MAPCQERRGMRCARQRSKAGRQVRAPGDSVPYQWPSPDCGGKAGFTEREARSDGVDRQEARRHVPAAVPGRERQGARPAFQAEGRRSAVAGRGHRGDGHRRLRRPFGGEGQLQGLVRRVVGPSGVGARDVARGPTGSRIGDLRGPPTATPPALARPALGQGHVTARPDAEIRVGTEHDAHALQLRPHGATGRRRRSDHQGGPVGRHRAAEDAEVVGRDDDSNHRGRGAGP